MDFTYSEEQEAVRQLAGQIFTDRVTHERLKQLEAEAGDEGPFDRELWKELAGAGLLGIHLSEDVGGAGLDFVAACLVVEAAGARRPTSRSSRRWSTAPSRSRCSAPTPSARRG